MLKDASGEHMATRGHEFGATTGRARRCGWFDAVSLRRAIRVNSISGLCITKLDVLDGLETIRICTGYQYNGSVCEVPPVGAEAIAACVPVYEDIPGWSESTIGMKNVDDLPANAQSYLKRIEELVEAPVDIISTGPDRNETIILRHPFEV
jgi:adenylosuccinate synthase